MTEFHGEFAKMYRFNVPIAPKNLSQMLHPFHGYLTASSNLEFSLDELTAFYEKQITASFERAHGRELLSDELSCLTFWMLQDNSNKGWMNIEEFRHLLHSFKFTNLLQNSKGESLPNQEVLRRVVSDFRLSKGQDRFGELLELSDASSKDLVFRFDLIRDVFLERGL
jgi:hypothetical protein